MFRAIIRIDMNGYQTENIVIFSLSPPNMLFLVVPASYSKGVEQKSNYFTVFSLFFALKYINWLTTTGRQAAKPCFSQLLSP